MLDSLMIRAMRILDIVERVRSSSTLSSVAMIAFAALLIFGALNCILGYRLLRIWMMLFGFGIGAGLGYAGAYFAGREDKTILIGTAVIVGVVLAVIAFLSYKVGIFILGTGIGLALGIYLLHPTSSLSFFICLLLGIILGVLAMRHAREVLIIGTSLLGGAMAGFALAKLGAMDEIPYGLCFAAAFAISGMLIQFATNKKYSDEDEEDEDDEEYYEEDDRNSSDYVDPREYIPQRKNRQNRKTQPASGRRSSQNGKRVDYALDEIAPELEKTVEYHPKRQNHEEIDIPLESAGNGIYTGRQAEESLQSRIESQIDPLSRYGNNESNDLNGSDENRYIDYNDYDDIDEDYDEPEFDEEAIEEEIYREMLEEDSMQDQVWQKIAKKRNRRGAKSGKRS